MSTTVTREAETAGRWLAAGKLVAFATETVYGLGGDATNARAVAGIYEAKGRPSFNPLIVHVADTAAALRLGVFNPAARLLADRFWPGPLTIVVPRAPDCPVAPLASAGLDSIALRIPGHSAALGVLRAAGVPVAAPSANRSGRVSPTTASHVLADLDNRIDMVLDAGPCAAGVESSIVSCLADTPVLLRLGAVTLEDLEAVLENPLAQPGSDVGRPVSPGQLASHYAPEAALRLNAHFPEPGEAFIAFGPMPDVPDSIHRENLSETGDLVEAAARLFAMLRRLDETGVARIAVMPIPDLGIGRAVNDRLRRAAAPRP